MLETSNYNGGKRKFPGYQKRTTEQRETDILFCSDLFLKGYTYREIARMLNKANAEAGRQYTISFQRIYKDMEMCLIEWKRERMQNIDDYVTQELRKLDRMEVVLWNAWEESRTGKKREKKRKSNRPFKVLDSKDPDDFYGYDESQTETSAGNPKFMDLLLDVQQRRAKLLGYDAPVKLDITPRNNNDDGENYDIGAVPDELLFAVVDKLQDAKFIEHVQTKGSV